MKLQFWKMRQTVLEIFILVNLFRSYRGFSHFGWQDRTGQNLHADGLYHEPASKCNFDLNRQNTLLLNLFGTIGRKNTTLDGMYHMLLVTVHISFWNNYTQKPSTFRDVTKGIQKEAQHYLCFYYSLFANKSFYSRGHVIKVRNFISSM